MRAMGSVAGSKLGVPVVMQLHEGAMQPYTVISRRYRWLKAQAQRAEPTPYPDEN